MSSGILERKSNSMFSSSWKQQWVRGVRARLNRKSEHKPTLSKTQVQLTGNRELKYWNTAEIPDDDEEPYRVLKLKGT